MKHKIVQTLLMVFCFCFQSIAQEYLPEFPSAKEVLPNVIVNVQMHDENYYYSYKVKNQLSAKQSIESFLVQIGTSNFELRSRTYWRKSSIIRDTIIAVKWFSLDSLDNIYCGQEKDSFNIISNGLPTIQKYFACGAIDWSKYQNGEYDFRDGSNDIFYNSYKGYTISPSSLPIPFVPITFLDTIKSYVQQSRSFKWIIDEKSDDKEQHEKDDNNKLVKELIKYLDKAREQLAKNKIKEAKRQLKEFVEKVEENYHENDKDEEKEKHEHGYLTSEAYALLKYNAEYLIEKLK